MVSHDPLWTAPRVGQDWTVPEVARLVDWFKSLANAQNIESRMTAQAEIYRTAISLRQRGEDPESFDARDLAAWYLLQARSYATDRLVTDHDQMVRIAPYFKKIAENFDSIVSIPGIEERAKSMLFKDKAHPDSVLFELIVALSYKVRGWRVEFVAEAPGVGKRPDMFVFRQGTRWAVECKRLRPSIYEQREKREGKRIAAKFHDYCKRTHRSLCADIIFKKELFEIEDDFLLKALRLADAASQLEARYYEDEAAAVRFRSVRWDIANQILSKDDVFYGGSRMIELLKGEYVHSAEHSMSADWVPAQCRPAFATRVDRASVVSWWSDAGSAKTHKARYFKRQLDRAVSQLPADRPGVVHIGSDRHWDNEIEGKRLFLNWLHLSDFRQEKSRLRWVNCSYFLPEATTHPEEVWAMNETFDPIKVGRHSTRNPMQCRFLIVPEHPSASDRP